MGTVTRLRIEAGSIWSAWAGTQQPLSAGPNLSAAKVDDHSRKRQLRLKIDHELVTSGPCHFVRHPIYSGMLTALFGSGLVGGPFWKEETYMVELFPDQYLAYRGASALYWAAINGQYDRVDLLLKSGAEPRQADLDAAHYSGKDSTVQSSFAKTRDHISKALESRVQKAR